MKIKNLPAAFAALFIGAAHWETASAQIWTQTGAPSNTWSAVTISQDGTRLVAVGGHVIYTSTNYGSTWVSNNAPNTVSWVSVAGSADGTKLVSASGVIYTNSGTTWAQAYSAPKDGPSPEQNITSVASSADGTKLVAASSFGDPIYSPKPLVYVSANAGATWTSVTNAPTDGQFWSSVASSADGNKLAAAMTVGGVLTSANAGTTWVSNNVPPVSSLASSADGNELYAAGPLGLAASTNAGASWAVLPGALFITNRIACSTNGLILFGLGRTNIYSSFNGGSTWSTNTAARTNWSAIALSATGLRGVAAASGGGIYILQPPPLTLTLASQKVSLLWATNYATFGFGLEQNTNLTTTNWLAVTNLPTITNFNYQITLPATNSQLFFRLEAP